MIRFLTAGFLLLIFCSVDVIAQDSHYSQFYNSPLTLNPAITGKINGTFRIAMNYRNQWFGITTDHSPYVTPSASVDFPVRVNNDALGFGVMVKNDRSGGGRYNSLQTMGSAAYHKALGENANHSLSLGIQGGYHQKSIDLAKMEFGNQYNGEEFNTNLNSGENIDNTSVGFADFRAGLFWNARFSEQINAYAGFSVFHILEPSGAFLENTEFTLPRKYMAHGGLEYKLNKRFSLLPSVIYMKQSEAQEINAGLAGSYRVTPDATVYAGGYFRVEEEAIAYLAVDIRDLRLGFSYDFPVSQLREADGSFEVSLTYVGQVLQGPDAETKLFCPRF